MRNLILVAVILQLAIIIKQSNGDFKFGDIISFERKCFCNLAVMYKHFAIYVGKEALDGKEPQQDIFHRMGKKAFLGCGFDVLADPEHTGKQDNYLDKTHEVGSAAEISARIQEMRANCGVYAVRTNNCEHLATYVRYGEMISQQPGTIASHFCKRETTDCPKFKSFVSRMEENAKNEERCMKECAVQAG